MCWDDGGCWFQQNQNQVDSEIVLLGKLWAYLIDFIFLSFSLDYETLSSILIPSLKFKFEIWNIIYSTKK